MLRGTLAVKGFAGRAVPSSTESPWGCLLLEHCEQEVEWCGVVTGELSADTLSYRDEGGEGGKLRNHRVKWTSGKDEKW